jgi:hypothetical protein
MNTMACFYCGGSHDTAECPFFEGDLEDPRKCGSMAQPEIYDESRDDERSDEHGQPDAD